MDLARAPRRAPLTARKKGSGYENERGVKLGLIEYNCCEWSSLDISEDKR
jgi:hypothetical protein